jgi:hypothetical protein
MEVGADLPGFVPSPADVLLDSVYGDHSHNNPGTHLDGGVSDDAVWQSFHARISFLTPHHYSVPSGRIGRKFITKLTAEFHGARLGKWNSERPLTFATVILQTVPDVRRAQDIRARIEKRMSLWDAGQFSTLIADTEAAVVANFSEGSTPPSLDTAHRKFNETVLSGRLRQATRNLLSRETGKGVLPPDALCTKTGEPVLDVLRAKHPPLRDPAVDLGPGGAFEPYPECPTAVPIDCTGQTIESVASSLTGSAGPSGVDAVAAASMLLRFGKASEGLRTELAAWVNWLSESSPPWARYRALMASRLIALDKDPGVRPIGIGEIWRRLFAKCVLRQCVFQATVAAGDSNLCVGLAAGIEAAVHAATAALHPPAPPSTTNPPSPLPDPPPSPDPNDMPSGSTPLSQPPSPHVNPQPFPTQDADDLFAAENDNYACFFDARNGFNEISRKAMLWTVRHRWPNGARFAFNCYRHSSQLFVRASPGQTGHILLSQEGVTQGDPLAMILFGITVCPLAEFLRTQVPTAVQPWFADDAAAIGDLESIAQVTDLLVQYGPNRGYYVEPTKSTVVCKPDNQPQAQQRLSRFQFKFSDGERYVGGFLGSSTSLEKWLTPQIDAWVDAIHSLASVARKYPQSAYAALTKSLQAEWQYLQRVLPNSGPAFQPIEDAIHNTFLPSLFLDESITDTQRKLFTLPVRHAGLSIPNPCLTAHRNYSTSLQSSQPLLASLQNINPLDVPSYCAAAKRNRRASRSAHDDHCTATLTSICQTLQPHTARTILRAQSTGAWLTVAPNRLNGTELSRGEFRDSLRLRYELTPHNLPTNCDGCGHTFDVNHALTCPLGGKVLLRHHDVKKEFISLCSMAFSPSAVSDEPFIPSSQPAEATGNTNNDETNALRGDVGVRGFWNTHSNTIFDVRVTHLDSSSYRDQDPKKILVRHEQDKRRKYQSRCHEARIIFTPLVFSVDGMMAPDAQASTKRLAGQFSSKWGRAYSAMCGFVRARISIALVRSTHESLRGARSKPNPNPFPQLEDGSGTTLCR